jgi:hypothetical protein
MIQVPWQTDNKYIRRGYRKRMYRLGDVIWSLIGCMSILSLSILNDIPFKQRLTCL